jgi:hypothetical protein
MNALWYSEGEYSQNTESTVQQMEYSAQGRVQINPNSLFGIQHYKKLQQHKTIMKKQVNPQYCFFIFSTLSHRFTHTMRHKEYPPFSSISIDNTLSVM